MKRPKPRPTRPRKLTPRHAGARPRTLERTAIGKTIESLAVSRGYHLDELAAAAGIKTPTLYRIVTGKIRRPSASTVMGLARALAVPMEKLVG